MDEETKTTGSDKAQDLPAGANATGEGVSQEKPVTQVREELSEKSKANPEIWLCTECGREHVGKTPFPKACACGNLIEDAYRLKEIYDYEAEKAGKPLAGIKRIPHAEKGERTEASPEPKPEKVYLDGEGNAKPNPEEGEKEFKPVVGERVFITQEMEKEMTPMIGGGTLAEAEAKQEGTPEGQNGQGKAIDTPQGERPQSEAEKPAVGDSGEVSTQGREAERDAAPAAHEVDPRKRDADGKPLEVDLPDDELNKDPNEP